MRWTRRLVAANAAAAAIVLPCGVVDATSFHVSNAGNDTAAGTSPDTAWRTLARASTVRLAGPDDSLLLERGAVFADDFLSLAFPTGTLGAYGNDSLPHPEIVRRWQSGPLSCVLLLNPTALTVENLHVAGCSFGFAIEVTPNAVSANVTLRGNFARDIQFIDQAYNPSKSSWGSAITLRGGGGGAMKNLTVANNVGVRLDTFFDMGATPVDGMVLDGNTVASCGFNCMFIGSGNDIHLRNSVFLHDTSPRLFM